VGRDKPETRRDCRWLQVAAERTVTGFYTIFHNKCDYRSKVSGFEVRWTVMSIAERKKKKEYDPWLSS
jgi:hypothetical protein